MNCPFLATEPLACLSSSGHIWGLFSTSTDLTGYLSINGQLISQCLAILENCIFTLKECPRARAPWSWPCWVWDVNVSVGSRGINYSFCVTNPRIWTHSILRYQDNVECLSETVMWCFSTPQQFEWQNIIFCNFIFCISKFCWEKILFNSWKCSCINLSLSLAERGK